MKKLILITLLTFSFDTFAAGDGCRHCAIRHGLPVNSELDLFASISAKAEAVLKKTNEAKLKKFIKKLCRVFNGASKTGTNPKLQVQNHIMTFLNEPTNSSKKEKLAQVFFNRYNNYLYCENTFHYASTKRPKQHLFKLFVDYREDQDFFYEWFAVRGNSDRPNMNAVQEVNGKKETLLDYIDYLIETNNKDLNPKELKKLRRRLKRYGARKAVDLK